MATLEMIRQARIALHQLVMDRWLTKDVFSFRWLGMLGFIIISYVICLILLDKKRLSKILLFGSLLTVGMVAYETVGVSFALWYCATPILPIIPCIFASDLTIIPLYYMLVYQYTSSWKQFCIWNAITAATIAFVFQPIVVYFGIFELDNWHYIYTFFMVFAIASLARAVTQGIIRTEKKHLKTH